MTAAAFRDAAHTGAETVRDAIRLLRVERIGHGIRCLDDPELAAELRATRLPLEVCPTSNYRLGVVAPEQPHPIRRMFDEGLFCTVNSDDPPMFGTTLIEEYCLLARQGFTLEELQRLNLNAVEACFLLDHEKDALRRAIEEHKGDAPQPVDRDRRTEELFGPNRTWESSGDSTPSVDTADASPPRAP